jgi:Transcriptional regulator, AbiEi antitoxin
VEAVATRATPYEWPNTRDRAKFAALAPIFSYSQAREAGLSQRRIYWLRDHGFIEPLAQGTYRRSDIPTGGDPDLTEIATRAPLATLCLTSALVRHDLTDAIPSKIDIALPRGTRRPPTAAPVRWHLFDSETFQIGRDLLPLSSADHIGLYGPERSIVDAFRLRHNEGPELAHGALRRWLRRRGSSPAELMRMAQHFPKALPALRTALEILL